MRIRAQASWARASIVAAAAFTAACAPPVTVAPIGGKLVKRPSLPADSVRVYFGDAAVPAPFDSVARLSTHARWDKADEQRIVSLLKAEAGRLGANAVILYPVRNPSGGAELASVLVPGVGERAGSALAIFITSRDSTRTGQ